MASESNAKDFNVLSADKYAGDAVATAVYSEDDQSSIDSAGQGGVKRMEAISTAWGKWSLVSAYIGLFLLAFFVSLEQNTTFLFVQYATSAFSQVYLTSTIYVVQSIVNAGVKPPMAKIANVFGRLEAYAIAIGLYVIGYIQMAASQNFQTYASAQIFYSCGSQGIQVLNQIFIADTTDLLWRALFISLPDTPFLVTTWAGAPLAQSILSGPGWRWGYGIWTIILPISFMPLAVTLLLNLRKAKKMGLIVQKKSEKTIFTRIRGAWFDLDIFGLLLFIAAIALILLPLTLAETVTSKYQSGSIIAMFVVGGICLIVFPLWESSKILAPSPFLPLRLLRTRNFSLGCLIGFFYFGAFYTSVFPYYVTYLEVVQNADNITAGHITLTFSFASTVTAVVVSILIKYTKNFKWWIILGAAVYLVGIGLMTRYRDVGASTGTLVGVQICAGIGGGMLNIPALLAVQASVLHADVAAATAIFLTITEVGGAVGAAVSGAIWTANIPAKLAAYLPAATQDQAAAIYGSLVVVQQYPPGSPTRVAIDRAYQETMDLLLIVAVCFAAVTFLLSLLLRGFRLDQVDQKVRGTVVGHAQQAADSSPDVNELQNTHRGSRRPLFRRFRSSS